MDSIPGSSEPLQRPTRVRKKRARPADIQPETRYFGRKLSAYAPATSVQEGDSSLEPSDQNFPLHQMRIDKRQQFLFDEIGDFDELLKLHDTLRIDSRVDGGNSIVAPGQRGAFAHKPFVKGELVGFFKGELVLCKSLPANPEGERQQIDYSRLVWNPTGGEVELRINDDFAAWTNVYLPDSDVRLGCNGHYGGNRLQYINHSEEPNVEIMVRLNTQHLSSAHRSESEWIMDPEKLDPCPLVITVVANQRIKNGRGVDL